MGLFPRIVSPEIAIVSILSNTSSVSNTIIIASVIVSIGYFFLNLPIKKMKNQKQKGAFFRVFTFLSNYSIVYEFCFPF